MPKGRTCTTRGINSYTRSPRVLRTWGKKLSLKSLFVLMPLPDCEPQTIILIKIIFGQNVFSFCIAIIIPRVKSVINWPTLINLLSDTMTWQVKCDGCTYLPRRVSLCLRQEVSYTILAWQHRSRHAEHLHWFAFLQSLAQGAALPSPNQPKTWTQGLGGNGSAERPPSQINQTQPLSQFHTARPTS